MPKKERTDFMIDLLRENGYGMRDLVVLGKVLTSKEFQQSITAEQDKMDERIIDVLFRIGIPGPMMEYLRQAVKLKVDTNGEMTMGQIYQKIANNLGTRSGMVETRIKAAIEIVWRSSDRQHMKEYLGEDFIKQEHRSQNRVFINALVQYLMEKGLK